MLLLSWAGPAASAPRLVEQNIAVEKNAHIAIRNASGQVVVKSWDRPQVHLIWTPSASGIDLDIEQLPASGAADRIRLTTEAGNGHMTNVQGPADLTVEVPPSASLDIRNPEGSVLVRGLQGAVSIATSAARFPFWKPPNISPSARYRAISGSFARRGGWKRLPSPAHCASFSPPVSIFGATPPPVPSLMKATYYLARTTISPPTAATSTSFAQFQLLSNSAPIR
jgi:hypothetical protein